MHADEPRNAREHRANQETECGGRGQQPPRKHEDDDADDGDGGVLARQICLCAFTDGCGDFLHACVALIGGKHRFGRPDGVQDRKQAAGDDDIKHGHCRMFLTLWPARTLSPGRCNKAAYYCAVRPIVAA
jgi:hypothetical protein